MVWCVLSKTEFSTHAWGPSEVHDAPTILALDSSTLQNLPCLWKTSFRAYFPRKQSTEKEVNKKNFHVSFGLFAQYFSASLKLSLERAGGLWGGVVVEWELCGGHLRPQVMNWVRHQAVPALGTPLVGMGAGGSQHEGKLVWTQSGSSDPWLWDLVGFQWKEGGSAHCIWLHWASMYFLKAKS